MCMLLTPGLGPLVLDFGGGAVLKFKCAALTHASFSVSASLLRVSAERMNAKHTQDDARAE